MSQEGIKGIRRELFVGALLQNPDPKEAIKETGLTSRSSAHRLLNEPETQELIRAKLDEYEISNDKILRHIAMRAFSNVDDLMSIGEDGVPTYDLTKATREQRAAIAEVTVDETGGDGDGERRRVRRVRIKMTDSLRALELLARNRNLLKETIEIDIGEGLASRLGGARHRTIDSTPAAAQLVIDAASTVPAEAIDNHPAQLSTSLPPIGEGVGDIDHMQNPKITKVELVNQLVTPSPLALLGSICGDGEDS